MVKIQPRMTRSSKLSYYTVLVAFFVAGLLLSSHIFAFFPQLRSNPTSAIALRENGYQYTYPLLLCNINESTVPKQSQSFSDKVSAYIDQQKDSNAINSASVYYRNLKTGAWFDVNPDERFSLASLGKLPIMIAYLKMADMNPAVLNEKIAYTGKDDLNTQQEISPEQAITPGVMYTVGELIERMVMYSDNNATMALYENMDKGTLKEVYADLNINLEDSALSNDNDFITTRSYALFYRVLFNATYLSKSLSEKALQLLTQANFAKGLIGELPKGTVVAHKFGLTTFADKGIVNKRELHECGVIYDGDNSYLLCVMTKSNGSLSAVEGFISGVSKLVFDTQHKAK